ncbi:MAG: hypothetical protein ABI947_05155 [Chloroflexota bacterium]
MATSIEFYDVKLKQKVSVPEKDVTKTKFEAKNGRVTYGLRGKTEDGRKLTKFIGKADWEKMKVPEEKKAPEEKSK